KSLTSKSILRYVTAKTIMTNKVRGVESALEATFFIENEAWRAPEGRVTCSNRQVQKALHPVHTREPCFCWSRRQKGSVKWVPEEGETDSFSTSFESGAVRIS